MPLLSIALTLALIGFWVYCLLDVITTDAATVRNLPKLAWVLLVALFGLLGGVSWLLAGRPARRPWVLGPGGQVGPVDRPPRQSRPRPDRPRPRPLAPDDNPEFLRKLDRRLRGEGDSRPGS